MKQTSSKRILSVKVKRVIDDSPDTSWLGEFSDDPKDFAIVATGEYEGTFVDDLPCEECNKPEADGDHDVDTPQPAEGITCECSDPACPHCSGKCKDQATMTLWRVDMEDRTGSDFCQACGEDCMDAGVFTPDDPNKHDFDPVSIPRGRDYRYFNAGTIDAFKPDATKTPAENKAAREAHDQDMRQNAQADYKRMCQLHAGDFCFIGIAAEAEYTLRSDNGGSVVQRLHSGGLWGIESDSDASYIAEVESEELGTLRAELEAVGFSKRAISAAMRNVSHVDA